MAVWELALVIFAVTYMVVNMVALMIQVNLMIKMSGIYDKSIKYVEKLMDKSEKALDDLFDDL